MRCGRCCETAPRSTTALRLDIFIEILLGTWVNKVKKKGRGCSLSWDKEPLAPTTRASGSVIYLGALVAPLSKLLLITFGDLLSSHPRSSQGRFRLSLPVPAKKVLAW